MAQTAGHVAIPGLTLDGVPAQTHTMTSSKSEPAQKTKGRQSKKPRKKAVKKGNIKNGNVKTNDSNGTSSHSANHPLPQPAAVIHDPSSSSSQTPLSRESTRDPRLPPSAASGGIPNPSPTYLAEVLSSPPSAPLPEPRRILVVIDLNGTLLFRPYRHRPSHFVLRPHAQRFLAYCIDTFHVAIWSSARPENVQRMVAQLLTPEQLRRCVVVWARDKFELSPSDYKMRVQCYKRLSKLWDNLYVRAAHPGAAWGGKWDRTNTVLLDDSIEKARSEPFNILQIPEFVGLHSEPPNVLPQVHDYLNQLSSQVDVSKSIRAQPFALNPSYQLTPEGSDLGLPFETKLDHPYR